MDKEIEDMARDCSCIRKHNNPRSAPLHTLEHPTGLWERIHVDFAGPFMGKMFLIVVDAFSKWIEVGALNNCTYAVTVTKLRRIFAMHGLPQVIVSDNEPAFVGPELAEFLRRNKVRRCSQLLITQHPMGKQRGWVEHLKNQ